MGGRDSTMFTDWAHVQPVAQVAKQFSEYLMKKQFFVLCQLFFHASLLALCRGRGNVWREGGKEGGPLFPISLESRFLGRQPTNAPCWGL